MALQVGAQCKVRQRVCSHKQKKARISLGMGYESVRWRVAVSLAQEFSFLNQKNGSPRGLKQGKTDVLLMTGLGPVRRDPRRGRRGWRPRRTALPPPQGASLANRGRDQPPTARRRPDGRA